MTIFALAIATNLNRAEHIRYALQQLRQLGQCCCSKIYQIPCREHIGEDYWNSACLLHSDLTSDEIIAQLKAMEQACGRKRPSHKISLDVDLIAWGQSLDNLQFNPKKWPLAMDVMIPLAEICPYPPFVMPPHHYQSWDWQNL